MALAFSGGKEVCRRGWLEEAEVVESMEVLRRFTPGAVRRERIGGKSL